MPTQRCIRVARLIRTLVIVAFVIVAGLLSPMVPPSLGQDTDRKADVSNRIRGLERSKFDALQRRDNATLDSLFDDALLQVDPDGLLRTKADYLASNSSSQILSVAPATMTVQVYGHVAVAAGTYIERGVRAGRPYVQRCRFIDTWDLKNGKWVCIAATATSTIS